MQKDYLLFYFPLMGYNSSSLERSFMKANLEIHSENILPLSLKNGQLRKGHFVRELTSNASDACAKNYRLLRIGGPFSIDVRSDAKNGILEFEDNGMDEL